MENSNNVYNEHDFYFLVFNYVENRRKEDELFSIVESELSEEQYMITLKAISSLVGFLIDDVYALEYYLKADNLGIQEHHIQHFIDELNSKLPKQDKNTFLLPDYRLGMTIEKMKRSIAILKAIKISL